MHSVYSPITEEFVSFEVCHGWIFSFGLIHAIRRDQNCTNLICPALKRIYVLGCFLDITDIVIFRFKKSCNRLICRKLVNLPEYDC